MFGDARRDVQAAEARLLEKVGELPALREALIAARETLLWVGAYPEHPEGFGFTSALALRLLEPVRRTLNTTARLDYQAVVAALEEDATALAGTFSPGAEGTARRAGAACADPRSDVDTDPEMKAWKKQELERVRELYRFSPDRERLAEEAQ